MQKKIDKVLDDLVNASVGVISIRDRGVYTQDESERQIARHKRDAARLLDALYNRKYRLYAEPVQ